MRELKISLFMLVAGIFFISCGSSAPTAKSDAKKLAAYSTYAYLPNRDTIMSRDFDNNRIQEVIIETINANMRDEGFVMDKLQPDVLVHVHAMFDEKVAVNANPVYTNYPYYKPGFYIGPYYKPFVYENYYTIQRIDGPRVSQVPFTERTIVIDFIDKRTNTILWRGTTEGQIEKRRLEREIRDYIDEIFKNFP